MPEFKVYDVIKITYTPDYSQWVIEMVVLKKYARSNGELCYEGLILSSNRPDRTPKTTMLYRSHARLYQGEYVSTIMTRPQADKDALLFYAQATEERFKHGHAKAQTCLEEAYRIAGNSFNAQPSTERVLTLEDL